jgi:hypothetical protein
VRPNPGWQSCQDPNKILTRSYPRSYQDHAKILHKSCKIMERSCMILQDLSKLLQDLARSCKIVGKILQELGKILQDHARSCKIFPWSCRTYVRSWHDLGTNPARSCHDPSRSYQKSCEILPWSSNILKPKSSKILPWPYKILPSSWQEHMADTEWRGSTWNILYSGYNFNWIYQTNVKLT